MPVMNTVSIDSGTDAQNAAVRAEMEQAIGSFDDPLAILIAEEEGGEFDDELACRMLQARHQLNR